MTGVFVLLRRSFWIEAIHVLVSRRRCVQPFAIDDEVPVVANPYPIVAHGYEALNVMRVGYQPGNAFGGKHNDLTAFGPAEIVSQTIYKQMVAADYFQFDDVVSLVKFLSDFQSGAITDNIVRHEPERVGSVVDPERLLLNQGE